MLFKIKRLLGLDTSAEMLAKFLAEVPNREEMLGVKPTRMPTPEGIKRDAAKLATYSATPDYKIFADEAWGRIIGHLDKILDDRSSDEMRRYYCGAVKATLDLLRVSYTARSIVEQYNKEHPASSPTDQKRQG